MGDVINLRSVRKAKARAAATAQAAENRARFGRTKAEKLADAQEKSRAERLLDGAKRED
ncbi:DUF4169 family protein [Sphingomonas colocasiae]|uniref:DUF4169 family protein n=1 Tax=Sphingomonas colocasiae TaxID=1848973 RepID=A0ABS7PNU7_9SPHN|nr:DUF4169 family protein [Sphingomonas colocasiae]MBY8822998.1 DUF4169 family protein [Sphingomonas colocasiae]